jgi:hypothetical protein
MARAVVVEVQCDRCKRVEKVPSTSTKDAPDFKAFFLGSEMVFPDLCTYCKKAITSIWMDIKEWDRPVTHSFGAPETQNMAPPLSPAPDYTPPKPHSLAASTKK